LDKDSEGLIVLTNDGDLSLRMTHPRYKIEKEYEVKLDRPFDFELAAKMRKGIHIEGGLARAEKVTRISKSWVRVILRQGIKRQIRLMFYKLGYEVLELRRVRIGSIFVSDLRAGEWRRLSGAEIESLKRMFQTSESADPDFE